MVEDLDRSLTLRQVSLRDLYYAGNERTVRPPTRFLAGRTRLDAFPATSPNACMVMSMFFHGEECVTATLAPGSTRPPRADADLPRTQLADEAAHRVLRRFFGEVIARR